MNFTAPAAQRAAAILKAHGAMPSVKLAKLAGITNNAASHTLLRMSERPLGDPLRVHIRRWTILPKFGVKVGVFALHPNKASAPKPPPLSIAERMRRSRAKQTEAQREERRVIERERQRINAGRAEPIDPSRPRTVWQPGCGEFVEKMRKKRPRQYPSSVTLSTPSATQGNQPHEHPPYSAASFAWPALPEGKTTNTMHSQRAQSGQFASAQF